VRAGLYARVSTHDNRLPLQLAAMRELCRQARLENCVGNPGCWLERKSQAGGAAQAGAAAGVRFGLSCGGSTAEDARSAISSLPCRNWPH
jgi:hypothetical protein